MKPDVKKIHAAYIQMESFNVEAKREKSSCRLNPDGECQRRGVTIHNRIDTLFHTRTGSHRIFWEIVFYCKNYLYVR